MSANPVRLKYLFDKYLQNACSKAELQEFWELMSQLSENDLINGEMKALWDKSPSGLHPSAGTDREKLYRHIMEKAQSEQVNYLRRHRRRRPAATYLSIAASVLVMVLAGWWFSRKPAAVQPGEVTAVPASAVPSSYKIIELPDGTTAILNRHSELHYPPVFSGNTREVTLTGEAFFHVKKDPHKPFRVHAGNITTTVLGTTFNIKAYPHEKNIAVTVTSGRVQVSENRKTLAILEKNNQLVVNRQTGASEKAKVNAQHFTTWKQQDLVFKNITLGEAVVMLGYHFDADIRLENRQLSHCRFTGSFAGMSELEQVLDVITSITGSSWKRIGESILISGEACSGEHRR